MDDGLFKRAAIYYENGKRFEKIQVGVGDIL